MKVTSLLFGVAMVTAVSCRAEAVPEAGWNRISGWVQSMDLDNKRLQLRQNDGKLERIKVDDQVLIFRNWRLVDLDRVHINDRVTVRRTRTRW